MFKTIIFSIYLVFAATALQAKSETSNPNYDAELANQLGADDYGMKSYVFVILKSGDNKSTDSAAKSAAFSEHMANIERLVAEDKLIVAGPFGKMMQTLEDYLFSM